MNQNNLDHSPVALITGAAGGIGQAVSHLLAKKGYRIALVDINQSGLDQVKKAIGHNTISFQTDITDSNQVRDMVTRLITETGRIDVLINNAGMIVTTPFIECDLDSLIRENELNYLSAMYCTKAVLPHMQREKNGTVVSVASLAALLPLAASPGYSASKAALRGLMLSLNMLMKPHGVHVGCVCPSAVDTQMLFHEATNGGSVLNFLQKPLTTDMVARAIWKVITKKKIEMCLPRQDGFNCKLIGGFFPSILPKTMPLLEWIGERNRKKYLSRKIEQ